MERKFNFSIGEYYHIYNRGTDKRVIFLDLNHYDRFLVLLYLCNSITPVNMAENFPKGLPKGRSFLELFEIERHERLVDIVAYCLMPNHFHILIYQKSEGGIQKFMSKLSTAYSMYFNKKNNRTGTLFESRFKATHANSDEYLKYLFAYIHLNPVKIVDPKWKDDGISDRLMAQNYLKDYAYSSYLDWQGKVRPETNILNRETSPEYFTTAKDFDDFVNDWLTFKIEDESTEINKAPPF